MGHCQRRLLTTKIRQVFTYKFSDTKLYISCIICLHTFINCTLLFEQHEDHLAWKKIPSPVIIAECWTRYKDNIQVNMESVQCISIAYNEAYAYTTSDQTG